MGRSDAFLKLQSKSLTNPVQSPQGKVKLHVAKRVTGHGHFCDAKSNRLAKADHVERFLANTQGKVSLCVVDGALGASEMVSTLSRPLPGGLAKKAL